MMYRVKVEKIIKMVGYTTVYVPKATEEDDAPRDEWAMDHVRNLMEEAIAIQGNPDKVAQIEYDESEGVQSTEHEVISADLVVNL